MVKIERLGHVESEEYKPCGYCGNLVEVGRKKEGVWHKDYPDGPSRVYHRECLKKIVNLHEE